MAVFRASSLTPEELPDKFKVGNSFKQAAYALADARLGLITPCQRNPKMFDPRRESSDGTLERQRLWNLRKGRAALLCQGCEVLVECKAFALSLNPVNPEAVGIIAGQSFKGRSRDAQQKEAS